MRRGFLYLVAIMDWHTRKVLASRISNTLEADFCPSRQHLHRAAVADAEIRMLLPACLETGPEAKAGIRKRMTFYNHHRPTNSP